MKKKINLYHNYLFTSQIVAFRTLLNFQITQDCDETSDNALFQYN